MKITIVNRHRDDTLGGSELQCDFIATELVKRGYRVHYVAPEGSKEKIYDWPYTVLPCKSQAEDITREILSTEPDLVLWRFNKHHFFPVIRSLKKNKIPVLFAASSVNDVDPWFYKKRDGIKKTIKSLAKSHWNHLGMRLVDAVTVNNSEYLNRLSVADQYFVPNGMPIDSEPFEWNKRYCAWVSNIKQIKRPEKLVELATCLRSEDVDFIMVGDIQESSYEWMRTPGNLPDNVHYLGVKTPEEVNGILRSAEIHIHTCYPEGFPNVFIQAWMQGTPSVSLGFDPSNYLETQEMGFNAAEQWEDFKGYVKLLLEDDTKRKELGDNASRFAEETFRIEKTVDKLEDIFAKLTQKVNASV